jgi:hypothetical protein
MNKIMLTRMELRKNEALTTLCTNNFSSQVFCIFENSNVITIDRIFSGLFLCDRLYGMI